jgi:hypothetical protein
MFGACRGTLPRRHHVRDIKAGVFDQRDHIFF